MRICSDLRMKSLTLSRRRFLSNRNHSTDFLFSANKWTGFYMIGAVIKDLKENLFFCFLLQSTGNHWNNSTLHLHVQSQQWKHQNNKRNLFKINNKGTNTTSFIVVIHVPVSLLSTLNRFYTLYWYFHFWLWPNTDWEGEYWRKKAQSL